MKKLTLIILAGFLALLLAGPALADQPEGSSTLSEVLSSLPSETAPEAGDALVINDGSTTKKITLAALLGALPADVLPSADSTYDLGSPAKKWALLYVDQALVGDGSAAAPSLPFANDLDTGRYRPAADTIGWAVGGNKTLDLNSWRLSLYVPAATSAHFKMFIDSNEKWSMWTDDTDDSWNLRAGGSTGVLKALADGVVGLGVAPKSSWSSNYRVLQLGDRGALASYIGSSETLIMENAYTDGSYKRIANGYASLLRLGDGDYFVKVADTGAADSAITWKTAFRSSWNSGSVRTFLGSADDVRGYLQMEADSGDNGPIIAMLVAPNHDTSIPAYYLQISEDDLLLGPSTNPDAWKYDGTNGVWVNEINLWTSTIKSADGTVQIASTDASGVYLGNTQAYLSLRAATRIDVGAVPKFTTGTDTGAPTTALPAGTKYIQVQLSDGTIAKLAAYQN